MYPDNGQPAQNWGQQYSRGGLGGGTIAKSGLTTTATTIARALGAEFYSSATPTVQVTDPVELVVDGPGGKKVKAIRVDGVVTTTGNACMAIKGNVAVVVFDGPDQDSFLVVNTDTTGGPSTPPPPDPQNTASIIKSTRIF
jgi:hypothetical protein